MYMTGVAMIEQPPMEIVAEGFIGGKVAARHRVRPPGVARSISLETDFCGRELAADGSDWIRVFATIRDAHGTVCPLADDQIAFAVEGLGGSISLAWEIQGESGEGRGGDRDCFGAIGKRRRGKSGSSRGAFGLAGRGGLRLRRSLHNNSKATGLFTALPSLENPANLSAQISSASGSFGQCCERAHLRPVAQSQHDGLSPLGDVDSIGWTTARISCRMFHGDRCSRNRGLTSRFVLAPVPAIPAGAKAQIHARASDDPRCGVAQDRACSRQSSWPVDLRQLGHRVSRATVYRTLSHLQDARESSNRFSSITSSRTTM